MAAVTQAQRDALRAAINKAQLAGVDIVDIVLGGTALLKQLMAADAAALSAAVSTLP